jgi:hypothetical protein
MAKENRHYCITKPPPGVQPVHFPWEIADAKKEQTPYKHKLSNKGSNNNNNNDNETELANEQWQRG